MNDETQHAFDVKKDPKYRRVRDSQLDTAAQFAIIEARGWDDAINVLQQHGKRFGCQICVMAMYSIELYFKAILMARGVNVTTNSQGHDIESMFRRLKESEQQQIKEGIAPSGVDFANWDGGYIKLDSFETELEFISRDFVHLRYHYEKFMNGEPVYAFTEFIVALRDNAKKLAKAVVLSE